MGNRYSEYETQKAQRECGETPLPFWTPFNLAITESKLRFILKPIPFFF